MRKIHFLWMIIAVSAVLVTSTYGLTSFDEDKLIGRSGGYAHFYLKTDLSSIKMTPMKIYEIFPDEFNLENFKSVGSKFGLTGGPEFTDSEEYPATYVLTGNDGKILRYHTQTGVWIYADPNEAFPTVYEEPDLPDDSEAQQIAESFLKDSGFWSNDIISSEVCYQIQGFGIKGEEEAVIEEWIITKEVYFGKQLDGFPLFGDKSSVTIVEEGEIVSFIQSSRTFQTIDISDTTSLITPEKAFENLQEGNELRGRSRTIYEDREIDIENAYLCYHIDSILEKKGPVIPCYAFEGKLRDTGEEFRAFISAVDI